MKCPHCGKEIANYSRFCEFCGKKVEEEPQPVAPVQTEPENKQKTIYALQQEAKLNANKQQTVQSPLSSEEPTTKDYSMIGWVMLFITIVALVGSVIGVIAATS